MTDDGAQYLANWFKANCDEDWEHQQGVKIETTDNPGWKLQVDLYDTDLESSNFPYYSVGDIDADGLGVKCVDFKFIAYGGSKSLPRLLMLFKKFVESNGNNPLAIGED